MNAIVDNAPPSVSITGSWWIWETAEAAVYEQIIPLGNISITVECGNLPDRVVEYNPNRGPFPFKWDRRCGDGQAAASGTYSVVLRACDIYDNCGSARGKVEIPFIALVPATSTPMPTLLPTQQSVWYQTPTIVPSQTPTVQPTLIFPVLPAIGGEEGGGEAQGKPQPLLPLAAAALGTSVLLAAASRREEKKALAGETTPPVKVSTLAAIAGVVKESFDGIWNEAVRISPADAPTVSVRTTYVGTEDPAEYLKRQANTATVVSTGATGTAGKVIKKPSESTATTYQDYLYGTSTAKGVIGTTTGTTNSGQKKTTSVSGAKSTASTTSSAAKTSSSSTKATTTTSSAGVLNWITDTAKSAVNTVKSVVNTVAAAIPSTVNKVIDYVKEKIIPPILSGVGYLTDGVKSFKSAIQSIPEVIDNNVVDPFLNFCRTVPDFVVTNIADPMAKFEENTKELLSKIPNFVKTNIADPLTKWEEQILAKLPDEITIYNQLRGFTPGLGLIDTEKVEIFLNPGAMFELGLFANADVNIIGTDENIIEDDKFVITIPHVFETEFMSDKDGYSMTIYTSRLFALPEEPIEGIEMETRNLFSYTIDKTDGYFGSDMKLKVGQQIECTSVLDQKTIEHGVVIKVNKYMRLLIIPAIVLGLLSIVIFGPELIAVFGALGKLIPSFFQGGFVH